MNADICERRCSHLCGAKKHVIRVNINVTFKHVEHRSSAKSMAWRWDDCSLGKSTVAKMIVLYVTVTLCSTRKGLVFGLGTQQFYTEALFWIRCYRYICLRLRESMPWHIFGTWLVGFTCKMTVAGVRSRCECISKYYLAKREPGRRRETEKKEVREETQLGDSERVRSSWTWFTTDGYCLEFQGRDLMLRPPSISQTL